MPSGGSGIGFSSVAACNGDWNGPGENRGGVWNCSGDGDGDSDGEDIAEEYASRYIVGVE
jgi:hypothetical protein